MSFCHVHYPLYQLYHLSHHLMLVSECFPVCGITCSVYLPGCRVTGWSLGGNYGHAPPFCGQETQKKHVVEVNCMAISGYLPL